MSCKLNKTIVHVNQLTIRSNKKHNRKDPPIIIRKNKGTEYCTRVDLILNGQVVGQFVYSPDKPLSCGAKVYFETDKLEVRVHSSTK